MGKCPRIVIAAAHSGSGKTSLAISLTGALCRRGYKVQTFKVGPDFLDPTYLAVVSGRPCYNLDGWMMDKEHIQNLFERVTRDADIAVVEGVMGLFDGSDTSTTQGSTAQIAEWLDAPVLLIVNSRGMSRSFAALVKGFTSFEPQLNFIGVIANHCGSQNHENWLSASLAAAGEPPLVGAIPSGAFVKLPGRHLGLVTASEQNLTKPIIDDLSAAVERHVSIETLLQSLNVQKMPISDTDEFSRPVSTASFPKIRIGVACDDAFHFYYQAFFDALVARGCELVRFSPLADKKLPDDLNGIYIGGGYPEVHAQTLAANGEMMSSIRAFAASGRPVYAECGGLMYLSKGIENNEGQHFAMLDILPARTKMSKRMIALGYVEAKLTDNSLWGKKGDVGRGHEFHYSELIDDPCSDSEWKPVYELQKPRLSDIRAEGFQKGNILASYVHLYHSARPAAVNYFIEKCANNISL
jgi:cobyrinic acid a,c-diamide synthase